MSGLTLRTAVQPPVRGAGEASNDAVAALLTLTADDADEAPPLRVAVVRVGAGPVPCDAARAALRPEDRLLLAEAPAASVTAAIAAARGLLAHETSEQPAIARIFVLVAEPLGDDADALYEAVTALAGVHVGLDLFLDGDGPDPGALGRLAAAAGGDVFEGDAPGPAMAGRIRVLQRQRAAGLRLELTFAPGVEPGALFRVEPAAAFLGSLRLTPSDRTLPLDPGPLQPGRPTALLLTLSVPPRRTGTWRLARATVADDRGVRAQSPLVQRFGDEPAASRRVAADVVAARDRVEPVAWLEDVVHALPDGDHRRVAALLERLQRRFLELDRGEGVALVVEVRQRFLRTGRIDADALDALRRHAAT
jgi:hypothetical protein